MKTLLLSILSLITFSVSSQYVNIPDAIFKNYLIGIPAIDQNDDNEVSVSEAANYNGYISVSGLGITDLTGIEAFTGTIYLDCSSNALTSIDLSSNTGLSNILRLNNNQLTSIIFPPTSNVTLLHVDNNPFTSIDVSSLQTMTNLYISNCYNLASLDVTSNTNLVVLNISQAPFTSIDLTGLTNLQSIVATFANITGTFDLSPCTSLAYISCNYMDNITSLNIKNGNNMSVGPGQFDATNCPNLTCVTVDDVMFANAVWTTAVDPGVTFSANCSQVNGIEKLLNEKVKIYPNPVIDAITIQTTEEIESIKVYAMNGELIQTENTPSFSVAQLSKGVYTIVMQTAEGVSTTRFIKQ